MKNKKKILIVSIIVFILLIILVLIFNKKNSEVSILVTPTSSKTLIDNREYKNGTYKITRGKHTVKISKEGFETKEYEVDIKDAKYNIYNFLESNDDSTKNWYSEHPTDQSLLDPILSQINEQELNRLQKNNPIISMLPINIDEYRNNKTEKIKYSLSYKFDENNNLVLIFTNYSGNNLNEVIRKLKDKGFNYDDYVVEYYDYTEKDGWGKAF